MIKEEELVDQEELLDEAQTRATQNASLMKSALETGSLKDALKYADEMLSELRASKLSPKYYYMLCMEFL